MNSWYALLGCIYTTAKAKVTSLPICCIVFSLCIYTTETAAATKIKEKNRFRFRSSINAALHAFTKLPSPCGKKKDILHQFY